MKALQVGHRAPSFQLVDAHQKDIALADYRGRIVVLYFYPKDDTPGCTKEACGFRDQNGLLTDEGVVVLGISPDSSESHAKFVSKYELPFPLLSDPDRKVCTAYGAYGRKKMYGKDVMGIIRSTFIIDSEGMIIKAYSNVKVDGHVDTVLTYIKDYKLHAK